MQSRQPKSDKGDLHEVRSDEPLQVERKVWLLLALALLLLFSLPFVAGWDRRGEHQIATLRPAGCAVVQQHAAERVLGTSAQGCDVRIDADRSDVIVTPGLTVARSELIALRGDGKRRGGDHNFWALLVLTAVIAAGGIWLVTRPTTPRKDV